MMLRWPLSGLRSRPSGAGCG